MLYRDPGLAVNCTVQFLDKACKILSVDDVLSPNMFLQLLAFELDMLLDVPESEKMLVKQLNGFAKKITSTRLLEKIPSLMVKYAFRYFSYFIFLYN